MCYPASVLQGEKKEKPEIKKEGEEEEEEEEEGKVETVGPSQEEFDRLQEGIY